MQSYKTLSSNFDYEFEVKKSRFIGRIQPIHSHEEGLSIVADLWKSYPDARHICYAMLVNGQVRMSDDGEPSGTAARPMLNVLQHNDLDHVLATSVRYFGGIKLGAGGLVRAYTQSISEPVSRAVFTEVKPQSEAVVQLSYEFEPILRHQIEQMGFKVDFHYSDCVEAIITGEKEPLKQLLSLLNSQMKGALKVVRMS